ncbi:MAG TPA: SDR family oxidoreductase [Vicinamibacterales bacterium]|nr:SDR family oxidoreductase [Vicinamibacterales bacterium]
MTSRRFLITGGSQGIGAALVQQARTAGHQVVFTGRNDAHIQTIADATGAHGIRADVSSDADNQRLVETCHAKMGGIDVLINNAAFGYNAEIGAIDMAKMRELFSTNVFGAVDLTNRVVPQMKERGDGDIVNIASTSGMKGAKGATVYAGSKWAMRGITQCWQADLRPHGIRVVCICPSEVQTNWMGKTGRNNPNKLYAEDIAATIMAGLEMPRRVLWTELAVFANNPWKED